MKPPDVTVVVPVYNTMPYLKRCLRSLATQSLGRDRIEVIAIDDGSTDGSGAALDRFARRRPDLITVLHQPNSGGPAQPCNRALDLAAGRYVFFLGADDYLGPQALQRMVEAADRYDSDVVLGKVVGVNSRYIFADVFARNEESISLTDSTLPWSLANVKLFRRDLLTKHDIRYLEDLPLGSDLPFTLAACYHAPRVSVVADYVCYHAVRRLNARNITYLSQAADRLYALNRFVASTAALIEPGPTRDAVLVRLFSLEAAALLRDDLLRVDPPIQQAIWAGLRQLADGYLSDAIASRLPIETRLRFSAVQRADLPVLLAMIRQDAEVGPPAVTIEGDRWYVDYPGFRAEVTADWAARLDATDVRWARGADGRRVLRIAARAPDSGPWQLDVEGITVAMVAAEPATARVDLLLAPVVAASAISGQRKAVHVRTGQGYRAPLRATGVRLPRPRILRAGRRFYAVRPDRDPSGQVMIAVVPVTLRRVFARLSRR